MQLKWKVQLNKSQEETNLRENTINR